MRKWWRHCDVIDQQNKLFMVDIDRGDQYLSIDTRFVSLLFDLSILAFWLYKSHPAPFCHYDVIMASKMVRLKKISVPPLEFTHTFTMIPHLLKSDKKWRNGEGGVPTTPPLIGYVVKNSLIGRGLIGILFRTSFSRSSLIIFFSFFEIWIALLRY